MPIWEEVVGKDANEAKKTIIAEFPLAQVQILPIDAPLELNFRPRRVRIFVDAKNIVVKPPQAG